MNSPTGRVHPCPACRHVPNRRTRQGSNCVHNMRLPEERVQDGKEHINLDNLCTSTWMPRHCQATGNFIPRYMTKRGIHTMHGGVLLARPQTRHVLLLLPHTDQTQPLSTHERAYLVGENDGRTRTNTCAHRKPNTFNVY